MKYARTAFTEVLIAAPQDAVFDIVTDVGAWGRFSPDCSGSDVAGKESLTTGSRFTGHNHGNGRRWRTHCVVTHFEQDRLLQFDSKALGLAISTWRYELASTPDGGTVLRHSWTDNRGWLMTRIGILVSGIRDRATHNTASMNLTLQRLKEHMEGRPASDGTG